MVIICCVLQVIKPRAKPGLLTNQEDTIPGPVNSIGALKMLFLGKHILGTQILTLGFYNYLQKSRSISGAIFLGFAFIPTVRENGSKKVRS